MIDIVEINRKRVINYTDSLRIKYDENALIKTLEGHSTEGKKAFLKKGAVGVELTGKTGKTLIAYHVSQVDLRKREE